MEEIKKYSVTCYAGGKNTSGYPYRAIIGLRREDDSLIGGAYFHRNPATMPSRDSQSGGIGGYIFCHYTWDDFPHVLDLLRNEKPTYCIFAAGSFNIGFIRTSSEPAGEGEVEQPGPPGGNI
jgi:hypothetical protein